MNFVTLTSPSYLIGTLVLMQSVKQYGKLKNWSWTIMTLGELSKADKDKLQRVADDRLASIVNTDELPQFTWEGTITQERRRLLFNKLSAFCLPPKQYCFLDSDMICTGDLTGLRTASMFTAVPQVGNMGPEPINHRPMFNTGFFVFQASASLFHDMQTWCNQNIKGNIPLGDQWMLNHFLYYTYPDLVKLFDLRYNTLQGLEAKHPRLWSQVAKDVRLYHFTSKKPWTGGQGPFYRKWTQIANEVS